MLIPPMRGSECTLPLVSPAWKRPSGANPPPFLGGLLGFSARRASLLHFLAQRASLLGFLAWCPRLQYLPVRIQALGKHFVAVALIFALGVNVCSGH